MTFNAYLGLNPEFSDLNQKSKKIYLTLTFLKFFFIRFFFLEILYLLRQKKLKNPFFKVFIFKKFQGRHGVDLERLTFFETTCLMV